jgi:hypothetical protein
VFNVAVLVVKADVVAVIFGGEALDMAERGGEAGVPIELGQSETTCPPIMIVLDHPVDESHAS